MKSLSMLKKEAGSALDDYNDEHFESMRTNPAAAKIRKSIKIEQ